MRRSKGEKVKEAGCKGEGLPPSWACAEQLGKGMRQAQVQECKEYRLHLGTKGTLRYQSPMLRHWGRHCFVASEGGQDVEIWETNEMTLRITGVTLRFPGPVHLRRISLVDLKT